MELISNELNNTSDVAVKLINGEKLQNKYSEVASSILEQFKKDNIKLDWTSKNDAEKKKLFHCTQFILKISQIISLKSFSHKRIHN
jgi:hypothetical protein